MWPRSISTRAGGAWLLLGLFWPGLLSAHDFWIEPSTFRPLQGETVAVGLRVGQDGIGDHVPYMSRSVEQFLVRQDSEDRSISAFDGSEPAALFRAAGNGTAVIGYSSTGAFVELPAERFEAYLKQYGLDEIAAERIRRGENGTPGRERFYRYAKALLTGATSSTEATTRIPFFFEILPVEDPTVHPDRFRGQIVYNGRPLANARVMALLKSDPLVRVSARSDEEGAFALPLPRSGVWLITSVHMVRAGFFCDCDWVSSWASLTFDTPGATP